MADTFTDGFCLKLIGLLDDKQIKIKEELYFVASHLSSKIYHKAILIYKLKY